MEWFRVALSAVSKAQGLLVLGVRFEWHFFQQRIEPRISVPETGCSIILVVVIAVSLWYAISIFGTHPSTFRHPQSWAMWWDSQLGRAHFWGIQCIGGGSSQDMQLGHEVSGGSCYPRTPTGYKNRMPLISPCLYIHISGGWLFLICCCLNFKFLLVQSIALLLKF